MTVPVARAAIVRTITGLQRLGRPAPEGGPRFTIMSRETAAFLPLGIGIRRAFLPAGTRRGAARPGMLPASGGNEGALWHEYHNEPEVRPLHQEADEGLLRENVAT